LKSCKSFGAESEFNARDLVESRGYDSLLSEASEPLCLADVPALCGGDGAAEGSGMGEDGAARPPGSAPGRGEEFRGRRMSKEEEAV